MPVRYKLVQHRITPDPNDFFASVQPIGTLDTEGLVRRLLEAGSTVTEADLRAVLALLRNEIHSALSEGYRVHLQGVGHLYLTIAGTFHGLTPMQLGVYVERLDVVKPLTRLAEALVTVNR